MAGRGTDESKNEAATRLLIGVLSAHADLDKVRAQLEDEEPSPAVLAAMTDHWRKFGPVHRTVAALLADEVRRALLGQLYGWRRQLREQLTALDAMKRGQDD